MMADLNTHLNQPYPPRTSSRFAPGVYFNLEWGVALNANDRPTHVRGVSFTSRRMQERFAREEEQRQQRVHQHTHNLPSQLPPLPISETNLENDLNWEYRDFQQERQRRHGVSTREQHSRGSSAPPSFERDEFVSPISPLSPEQSIRPQRHPSTFPRETLDRPLPYSPASFRLGEDELPWSTPLWYRPSDSEQSSPVLTRSSPSMQSIRRHSASQASIASKSSSQSQSRLSLMGGLPSLGYESMPGARQLQQRRSPRRREVLPNATATATRQEDPQRVRDLGELHSAMMGVDALQQDGWNDWGGEESVQNNNLHGGPRSLGWAVRTDPAPNTTIGGTGTAVIDNTIHDFAGFYARDREQWNGGNEQTQALSPPPAYLESQWEMLGRRIARPRSSDDRSGPWGITYWG